MIYFGNLPCRGSSIGRSLTAFCPREPPCQCCTYTVEHSLLVDPVVILRTIQLVFKKPCHLPALCCVQVFHSMAIAPVDESYETRYTSPGNYKGHHVGTYSHLGDSWPNLVKLRKNAQKWKARAASTYIPPGRESVGFWQLTATRPTTIL